MTTFTLIKKAWEFAKSCATRAMGDSVVYVPTCKIRVNFSFLRANVPINVRTCQCCANCANLPAKGHTNFSTIFQKNFSTFETFNYPQHLQISRIFGQFQITYLVKQRIQVLTFVKSLLRKNFVKPNLFISFSMEDVELIEKGAEYVFFIYLTLYIMHMHIISIDHANHNLAGKHTSCKFITKLMYCRGYNIGKHTRKKRKETQSQHRKKHSHSKVSYYYLESPIQVDYNLRRSQHSHVFFTLFS